MGQDSTFVGNNKPLHWEFSFPGALCFNFENIVLNDNFVVDLIYVMANLKHIYYHSTQTLRK